MDEKYLFQPLTKEDKITVVLYRVGIALSAIIIAIFSYLLFNSSRYNLPILPSAKGESVSLNFTLLIISLYISVGMSVFSIHLYAGKLKRALKSLYYLSIASLIILFIIGRGDVLGVVVNKPYGPLLIIPLSGCLGFITAKEAFCFRLVEGYILALLMPLFLLLFSARLITIKGASYGLLFIAIMLILFTFRKVFMPIHYDIGDKSAYT